ncbi:SNARE associated Golgi protein [Methylobacterium sp. 4-46]|uniref:DedA family protein n=1 Tax=unclassified Methylobacterium TaxID=2615210 RepID=UPI000152CF60|nr:MULTISPECIES: DedA family protein [Methylobacterium]ACA15187.1 SNARE associated Golgi protein [Methylobacterium sp. 4-46]WFT80918.1 DedA family protein [Methylobacterium nodulans]
MLHSLLGDLSGLIAQHGLWIVALIVGLESLGLPLPGETCLVTAAVYAGATGDLSLPGLVASAAGGAVVGDSMGFWIGRRLGQPVLIRHGPRIGLTPDKIKLGQYLFLRHGGKVVFFGRFVAVLRVLAALLAGANRMAWPRFLVSNATGGLLWATVFGGGAYLFGTRIEAVSGPLGIAFLAVAVITLAWLIVTVRRNEARLLREAERALPGPVTPR